MTQNRKSVGYNKKSSYVSGNNARKLKVAKPYSNEVKTLSQIEEERRQKRIEEKKIIRANHMNFVYTMMVIAIVTVIFTLCCQYLRLQTSVKNNAVVVSQLEEKVNTMTIDNEEYQDELNAQINYEEIKRAALQDLGMVYPSFDQVYYFDAGESEYVKQFADIPGSN